MGHVYITSQCPHSGCHQLIYTTYLYRCILQSQCLYSCNIQLCQQSICNNLFANSSIWPIDRTLTGTTTPGQSGLGNDGNEGVLNIPLSSRPKPHHQIIYCHIQDTFLGVSGVLTLCKRFSWHILQPKLTERKVIPCG